MGSFFGEEISQPDDVYQLAEENEENRDGDAVDARTDWPHRHENVVVEVSEGEQLQERHHLLGCLLRRRPPSTATATATAIFFATDLIRFPGILRLAGERRRAGLGHVWSQENGSNVGKEGRWSDQYDKRKWSEGMDREEE